MMIAGGVFKTNLDRNIKSDHLALGRMPVRSCLCGVHGGSLGNKWEEWMPSTSAPCLNHATCGVLHVRGVLDLEVDGECPWHGSSKIPLGGVQLGNAGRDGDDILDLEMECGCFPVGLTRIWVNLKVPGILSFTLGVHCLECKTQGQVLMLVNKMGVSCQRVQSQRCCKYPKLEFFEFRARRLQTGDVTLIPIRDVTFAKKSRDNYRQRIDPVSGQIFYENAVTGVMHWEVPKILPAAGQLEVVPMKNMWVALPGAQHDYYKYAQENFASREVRVERLQGRQYDMVKVRIVDEDEESRSKLTQNVQVTQCKNCQMPIEKVQGCEHMTCRCGLKFNFYNAAFY